jgi:hypothetical protein
LSGVAILEPPNSTELNAVRRSGFCPIVKEHFLPPEFHRFPVRVDRRTPA